MTPIDTAAIRAEWEYRKRSTIYGVEFENDDAATVLALCDEIDALRARLAEAECERDELGDNVELFVAVMADMVDSDADRDAAISE